MGLMPEDEQHLIGKNVGDYRTVLAVTTSDP